MSDFLTNVTALLNWILTAFSKLNFFSNNNPIIQGIINQLTRMGITPNSESLLSVAILFGIPFIILIISFAVGIFLRIAGSR